jgi:hypothetical protein
LSSSHLRLSSFFYLLPLIWFGFAHCLAADVFLPTYNEIFKAMTTLISANSVTTYVVMFLSGKSPLVLAFCSLISDFCCVFLLFSYCQSWSHGFGLSLASLPLIVISSLLLFAACVIPVRVAAPKTKFILTVAARLLRKAATTLSYDRNRNMSRKPNMMRSS